MVTFLEAFEQYQKFLKHDKHCADETIRGVSLSLRYFMEMY